ncbi:MAG: type II secretion system protein [Planctomycetota bacterium]|nr:MAG: type II secretion system protein [Planctomycetota bacterium]
MSRACHHPRAARAFTLLEVLLAISIASLLLGAVGKFAWDISLARGRLARNATEASCAEAVFTALERAMDTAVVEADGGASGIVGSEASLRVRSSSVQLDETPSAETAPSEFVTLWIALNNGQLALDVGRGSTQLDALVRALRVRYLAQDGWRDAFDSCAISRKTDGVTRLMRAPRADFPLRLRCQFGLCAAKIRTLSLNSRRRQIVDGCSAHLMRLLLMCGQCFAHATMWRMSDARTNQWQARIRLACRAHRTRDGAARCGGRNLHRARRGRGYQRR